MIRSFLVAAVIVASACGGSAQPVATAAPSAPASAAPTAQPTVARLPVRISVAADSLSYIDAWTSKGADSFTKSGLDVTWLPSIPDAAQTMALLINGQTDIVDINVSGPLAAVQADRDVVFFAGGPIGFTNYITMSKSKADELAKTGVTPSSPIDARLKALRGLQIGTGSAGGPGEVNLRKALQTVGMDMDKDVKISSGQPDPQLAAFRAGRLDVIIGSVPNAMIPQLDGTGVLWVSGPSGDVTAWNKGYNLAWVTTSAYAKSNPEVLRRVINGLQMTSDLIAKDPDAAAKALRLKFPDLDEKVFKASFDVAKKAYIVDPKLKTSVMQDTIDSYNTATTAKIAKKPSDFVPAGFLAP